MGIKFNSPVGLAAGFDYEAKKKKSFGLTNIQNRIQEIEGDLKVKSTIEEGTIYFISIPL